MIRICLIAVLIAVSASGCSGDRLEPRRCYMSGWMAAEACDYKLHELPGIEGGPAVGIRVYAYLQGRDDELSLTERRDGSGTTVRIGQILDKRQHGEPLGWMTGHKVSVHGIYHPDTGLLDVHSIGWVAEPDVQPPRPPARYGPGTSGQQQQSNRS